MKSSVCVVNVFCIPYFIKITLAIVTYAEVSSKEKVSLEEIDNSVWEIWYGFYKLGIIRGEEVKLERATQWHKKVH
ncbi:MAG: hypothetical protein ACI88H_001672 [Cocleimonas sp.]|jgi:hypothetical protein